MNRIATIAIVGALLCAHAATATAGQLYGLEYLGGQIEVFRIDPATGVMTPYIATGAIGITGKATFDPAGHRFFFGTSSDLYVVNVETRSVSHAAVAADITIIEFDSASNTLYGVGFDAGQVKVFTIDPATGAATPVITTGATGITLASAFDPVNRRLFFLDGNAELYVVSVGTGTVSHVNVGASNDIGQLELDRSSGTLFGIGFQAGEVTVFTIDPATGATMPRVQTGVHSTTARAAFDPVTQRLFFMSSPALVTVNVATGAVTTADMGGVSPVLAFDHDVPAVDTLTWIGATLLMTALAVVALRVIGR